MKKYTKIIALVLTCAMTVGLMAGCKNKKQSIIGKVNGTVIPDGLFINNFATEVYEAEQAKDTAINFDLDGEALYNSIRETKKDDKSYYDIFVDAALENSRKFMIQYQIFSEKEEWPSESDIDGLKKSAESYLTQMLSYYGSSMGASTVQELAQKGYSMPYDDLIEYFTMSSTLEKYKATLEEKVTLSEDEITEYYREHESEYRSVQVRHSLINTEKMEEDEKAEAYEKAQELVEKYNKGEITFDDILKESDDVSSEGKPNNDGYYTVQKSSNFVQAFKEWALACKEASNAIEIVETEYGYHIMQCTKVLGIEDDTVKETVESAYKVELVNSQTEEATKPYLENKDYEIQKLNKGYIEKLAKRTFTGDFSDVEEATATPAESVAPTAKPEYNDAAGDPTKIAQYKDQAVLKAYYVQFFSQAMNEIFTGYDFSAAGDSEEKFYELLNEAVKKEYKDGKTYLEYGREYGLELLTNFLATKDMATEAGKTISDEDKTKELEQLDSQIDTMLQYYGTSYGVSTRDELMQKLVSVNVNDYKSIYIDQILVSEYANEVIEEMKPEKSDLNAFYEKTPDDYRIVTIRHISKSLSDDNGDPLSEEEQANVLKLMETLQAKLENGDSVEALVTGYSDAADASSSKGLVDLKKTTAIANELIEWAFAQNQLGAISLIKTDSSYELVIIEGLTDYTTTSGIVANSTNTSVEAVATAVTTAYKNNAFEDRVQQYVTENHIALTEVQNDIVDQVVTDFLTYKKSDTEK